MLGTDNRSVYLEMMKPPPGFRFDRAVATTFTLDLLALLMAPLSLSLLEVDDREEVLKDPLLVIESLRRTADKIGIFCQEGMIAVPKRDTLLYSYLEQVVVQVQPEKEDAIFHPKVWVIRYVDDTDIFYRFLCLSRNLTFDRSWDTTLSLEGYVNQERKNGYSRNRPLSDFIASLPVMAVNKPGKTIREHVAIIQSEIRNVEFTVPPGFEDEIEFSPSGIKGYRNQDDINGYDRYCVISPFISDRIIQTLADYGSKNVLISRAESLDMISDRVFNAVAEKTDVYIMQEAAEDPDEYDEDVDTDATVSGNEKIDENEHVSDDSLKGIHAKVYMLDEGWYTWIGTGSANATHAGFYGGSVEFHTWLKIRKSRYGIDKFLGSEKNPLSFMNLLVPYKRPEQRPDDDLETRMEQLLENVRKMIIRAGLNLLISVNQDSTYRITMRKTRKTDIPLNNVTVTCYPITLNRDDSRNISALVENGELHFAAVSLQSLTQFMAFTVSAEERNRKFEISFVLNLPAEGMPEERDRNILMNIISNKRRFIQYLLLILMENYRDIMVDEFLQVIEDSQDGYTDDVTDFSYFNIPLLEEMVRAFSREPEKISRIERLFDEIKSMKGGEQLIPEHFNEIWEAFSRAGSGRGI